MRPSYLPCLLLLAPLLAGGAPANPIKQTWLPKSAEHWQGTVKDGVTLSLRDGSNRHVPGKVMHAVLSVKSKLEAVSGQRAELALVDTDQPNAYATVQAGRPIIALSLSYLERFGSDQDALAATIGHELAHLHLGHSAAAHHAAGALLHGVTGKVGAAESSPTARDAERDADRLGLQWTSVAGYDPCGQVRLFRAMSHDSPTLATHPGFAERAEAANEAAKKTSGRGCR
ncbi:MAG TPA: M48 family metalloprotease [Burkholderiales bacterium]